MYIHIEANDTNDQRSISPRFRASDVPETALVLGGLLVGLPGFNTDEGAIFVRRNADGDSLVLDPHGSNINFPATAVTSIYARALNPSSGDGGFDRMDLYTEPTRTSNVANSTFLRFALERAPKADSKIEIDIISTIGTIVGEFPAAEFEADHWLLNEIIPASQTNTNHMIDETMGRPAGTPGNVAKSYTSLYIGRGNTAGTEMVLVCPEWDAFGLMEITIREIRPAGATAGGRPDLFSAHMAATPAATLSTTPVNKLSITAADIITNRGGFTVESGTGSESAIQVASDGTYLVEFNVHVVDSAAPVNARAQVQADITVVRAGTALTDLTARTSLYWRGADDTDEIYVSGTHTVDLDADDQIEVRFATVAAETITWVIGGGESEISVVKLGGTSSSDDTAGQQLAGGLTEQVIVASRISTTEYGLGTVWTAVLDAISPTISPPIVQDNLLYISVRFAHQLGCEHRSVHLGRRGPPDSPHDRSAAVRRGPLR